VTTLENRIGTLEAESAEQGRQLRLRRMQVQAVSALRPKRCRHARLRGVQLPRVHVHHDRTTLRLAHRDAPAQHESRQQTQIAPAAHGQSHSSELERQRRKLTDQTARQRAGLERFRRCLGYPVSVVTDREYARVVVHAFVEQDIQCPPRRARDGKRRRPVPARAHPQRIFDPLSRAPQVRPQLVRRHAAQVNVAVAMAGNLVPLPHHLTQKRPQIRYGAAQNEKRRPALVLGKQRCDPLQAGQGPPWQPRPLFR